MVILTLGVTVSGTGKMKERFEIVFSVYRDQLLCVPDNHRSLKQQSVYVKPARRDTDTKQNGFNPTEIWTVTDILRLTLRSESL